MSEDRNRPVEQNLCSYARVAKAVRDMYVPHLHKGKKVDGPYMGTQRAPTLADEAGAICIVELQFGGRLRIYPADEKYRRVEHDREWRTLTHAHGAEGGDAAAKTQGGG